MTFGCILPNRGALATSENMRVLAVLAENLGFDSIWVSDHIILPIKASSKYPYSDSGSLPFDLDEPYCEPLTTLSYLAGSTHRIKLGTHVLVVPYRNPVYAAKIVATLDYLSSGRVILGIGVGWLEEEFDVVGQPNFAQRGSVTNEYIRIFKELWSQDSPSFKGRYYEFPEVKFHPKPVQKPHPPIWVGGQTDAAMRRAATIGDAWLPIGLRGSVGLGPEEMKEKIDQLKGMTKEAGRIPESVGVSFSAEVAFSDESSSKRKPFIGSAEEIIDDIYTYQQLGVGYFLFSFRSGSLREVMASMERFGRDVMPSLSKG